MPQRLRIPAALLAATLALSAAADWPCFRGPDGYASLSADDAQKLPADFDGPTGKLIRWKTPLPNLRGESSPIVTHDRVFLTAASDKQRSLVCYDADTGKLLWQKDVAAGGKNPMDPDEKPPEAGLAASTPATDGKTVVALFANGDLAAFDLDGQQLWTRALGTPESGYGFASSPIVHGGSVLIQFDQGNDAIEAPSSLLSIDIHTGKNLWQTQRPVHASWTTPIVIKAHDKTQVITVANPWIIAYNFDTGEELWRAEGSGTDSAPSAAFADGVVYTALARCCITAVKTNGKGDVTKTHIVWKNEDDRCPEVPSPVTNGKQLFLALDTGTVSAFDAATGKKIWDLACKTQFRASPTLVGDQLWIFDRKGVLHRIAAGAEGKLLGTADLGEKTDSQPAYAGDRIYIRGKENLYCVGAKKSP